MKGVKGILGFGLGAAYASSWWAAACIHVEGLFLWPLPIVSTVIGGIICFMWVVSNWE